MAQFLFHKIILGFYFIWRRRRRRNTFQWNWNGDGRGAQRDQRVLVGCAVLYSGMPRELLLRVIMISSDTAYRDRLPYSVSIYCCISGMCLFFNQRDLSRYCTPHRPIPSPIRAQIASPISREPFQFPSLSYDWLLFRGGGYPPSMTNKQWWRALIISTRYISGGAGGGSRESIACGIKKK